MHSWEREREELIVIRKTRCYIKQPWIERIARVTLSERARENRQRGRERGERNGRSRNRDWGRFPLILNKERKVVLFPPGFQTVWNSRGVKHGSILFLCFRLSSPPNLRPSLSCSLLLYGSAGATPRRPSLMLPIQFYPAEHCRW